MKARFLIEATCLVSLSAAGCERPTVVGTDVPKMAAELTTALPRGWSEPVNLGAPINSAGDEFNATLSPDGLSLYFNSDRTDLPGAQGGNDIWISRRACPHCPWGTPVNPGPPLNSAAGEGNISFSNDGRMMFFASTRPGGAGRGDIYVSHRVDPHDDFGWEPPVNLGPDVNTPDNEGGPTYLQKTGTLYFNRGVIAEQRADIYAASVTRSGVTLGPAVAVAELNDPTVNDGNLTVRRDGKELIFWSNRGSPPDRLRGDLFVSTRRNIHDPWSTPVNLGAPVNTEDDEIGARLSGDGRILLITSNRAGGLGGTQFGFDIWTSTRTPLDGEDGGADDAPRFSDWSVPVNLGPVVNSTLSDFNPSISKDGLSLYFAAGTNRKPNLGLRDIWVTHRARVDAPWDPPVNVGPVINTAAHESKPTLSRDGHRLYFASNRTAGTFGDWDLYVSQRQDERDDLGWGPPVNLGRGVNSAASEESGVTIFEDEETETTTLYFASNRTGGLGDLDIYASTLRPDGTFGPAVLVPELSSSGSDVDPAIRRDGLEMFLASNRPGTFGALDLWVSTRASTRDPWSTPVNLGPLINTPTRPADLEQANDLGPALSFDGTTLYFNSAFRAGNMSDMFDIWVATRARLDAGHDERPAKGRKGARGARRP